MELRSKSCANEECNFAIDGKCVEGYPLDECPHLTEVSVEEIEEVEEPDDPSSEENLINLALGDALSQARASSLQCRRVSRVVGIVGPNDAGKTSLVASVYDLLQEGPIGEVSFAGSSTLIGFEKICHDSRLSSRRDQPHMERTSAGAEATFFHLDLTSGGGEVTSLFIGDRSGEDYLAAADDLSLADEFFELRRADVVTLLVNGEQLASSEHRHEVKALTPQIVDALVEAKALRQGCQLAIVLTKKDAVLASDYRDRVARDFEAMVDLIGRRHADYLGVVKRFIVAASPKDATNVKRGEGVDQLLFFWLHSRDPSFSSLRVGSDSSRMIDLFDGDREVSA